MTTKKELVAECAGILKRPKVYQWYEKNLTGKLQGDILTDLEVAIRVGDLELREVLAIALIVGLQFTEKFGASSMGTKAKYAKVDCPSCNEKIGLTYLARHLKIHGGAK